MDITKVEGICYSDNGRFSHTEFGTAERFHEVFGEDFLWVEDTEKWKRYNKETGLWEDTYISNLVNNIGVLAKMVEDDIVNITPQTMPDGEPNPLIDIATKYVKSMRGLNHGRHALEYLKARIAVKQADFDSNPAILGLPGGKVFNLESWKVEEAKREYRLTKRLNGTVKEEISKEFEDFIYKILPDEAVMKYVQKYIGSSLLGYKLRKSDDKKVLFIDSSVPNTGKSTLLTLLERGMSDYFKATTIGILTEPLTDGNKPNPALAELQGARIAGISEISANTKFSGDNFKKLSGNDTLMARYPWDKFPFYYKPDFRILVMSNDLPRPDNNDDVAFRARFRRITFEKPIENPDANVMLKFDNPDFINNFITWVLIGCNLYMEEGLDDYNGKNLATSNLPDNMKAAIKKYIGDNDDVGDFFRTFYKITKSADDYIPFSDVYEVWKDYANDKMGFYTWCKEVRKTFKALGLDEKRKPVISEAGATTNPNCIVGIKKLEVADFYGKKAEENRNRKILTVVS